MIVAKGISGVLHSMVLSEPCKEMIWTGYPAIKYIDKYSIRDDKKREEVKNKLGRMEKLIRDLREILNSKIVPSKGGYNIAEITQQIEAINSWLINDIIKTGVYNADFLVVAIVRTYEEIKSKYPSEIKAIKPAQRENIEYIVNEVNTDHPLVLLDKYSTEDNRAIVKIFPTPTQEKQVFFKNNREKFNKNMQKILHKKNPTEEEKRAWIENMGRFIRSSDILSVVDYQIFAELITESTFFNYLIDEGLSKEEILDIVNPISVAVNQYNYNDKDIKIHAKLQAEYIFRYVDYINLDKLFLIFASRGLEFCENFITDLKYEDYVDVRATKVEKANKKEKDYTLDEIIDSDDNVAFKQLEVCIKTLREDIETILNSRMISSYTKISGEGLEEQTVNSAKEKLKNFCGNIYLTPNMSEYLIYELYNNTKEFWSYPGLLERLNLSQEDCSFFIARGKKNTVNLLNSGLVSKDFVIETLRNLIKGEMPDFKQHLSQKYMWNEKNISFLQNIPYSDPSEIYKELKKEKLIEEIDIKQSYDNGKIDIEEIEQLNVDESKMFELVSDQELIELYKEYGEAFLEYRNDSSVQNEQKLQKVREKKDRSLIFYRKFKLNRLTEEQRTENAEELILNYYADLDSDTDENMLEVLGEMYKDRLVNFESIQNTDEEFLKSLLVDIMLKRGQLTLKDTMQLRNILSFEEINSIVCDALEDKQIDENQKFVLVMNIFHKNTKEDKEARQKYLKQFKFIAYSGDLKSKVISPNAGTTVGDSNDDINEEGMSKNGSSLYSQNIYPDYIKWLFMQSIDENAIVRKYANGYVEFYLPKFDDRIIEKYYDVERYTYKIKETPVYGVATSIISDANFRANQGKLVRNVKSMSGSNLEVIDTKVLNHIVPRKDKVIHYTKSVDKNWMRSLVQHLGINLQVDSRYTSEELELLNSTINSLENLYEQR